MVSVSVLSNLYKIKYNVLNNTFLHLEKPLYTRQYLMVMDIGKIISMLLNIVANKEIIITNKIKAQVIISIFNIIAHYRHYFLNNLKATNAFVLYCENPEHYEEYEEIINDIRNICNFIPSIIVIPKMKGNINRYFYIHCVSYIIEQNVASRKREKKDIAVVVYGNNPLEYQYANIAKDVFFISNNLDIKVRSFPQLWEGLLEKNEEFYNPKYNYELRQLIYPYMIYYHKLLIPDMPIKYVSRTRYSTRINELFDFIDNFRNPNVDFYISYGRCLDLSEEDIKTCGKILNKILYFNNASIKESVRNFMIASKKKLYDKKMDNINEFNEILSQYNINIMWLREDKGM